MVSKELDAQDLIDSFFDALDMRKLDECQIMLEQLSVFSDKYPTYVPWCAYFAGILANERDRDWAEAERIFSDLTLKADLEPKLLGRVLLALGRTYDYQGRWSEALAIYKHGLAVFATQNQPVNQAKAWKQIALVYYAGFTRGDFGPETLPQAIECCQRALNVLEPIVTPPIDVTLLKGRIWNTFGLIYVSLGQWDQAIACYQQDLAICLAVGDLHGAGLTYGNLGEAYQKRHRENWREALDAYHQALTIIRQFDNQYEETEALANLGFLYQEIGEDTLALDAYTQAIERIESLRAGITSPDTRTGFFTTITDIYANAVLLYLKVGKNAEAFDLVERARSRAFLDLLTTHSLTLSGKTQAMPMTLAEIQIQLPADALLIEYFTTGLVEAEAHHSVSMSTWQRHRFPPSKILIFAVTCDQIQVYDANCSPNDLRPRSLENVVERHYLHPEIRRSLYTRLITPVEELLQNKRRLYLIPHGPLHYVPFHALIAQDGDTLLRKDGPQVIYAPSATLLMHSEPTTLSQASASCLAVGYNGEGAKRLRFAEKEARLIARLTRGQAFIGPSPKKMTLYSQVANYRQIHLACHGDFHPESPLTSTLYLAPDESLTALDIFDHFRLHCELVILSACESGLSRVRRGDELIGFIRAFMYAGAPALIVTLWRVDDLSTLILMEKFYQQRQSGFSMAESLQQAQLYLSTISRKEALETLDQFRSDAIHIESVSSGQALLPSLLSEASSPIPEIDKANSAIQREQAWILPGEKDDEKIYADPYFWAPFILVGNQEISSSEEE